MKCKGVNLSPGVSCPTSPGEPRLPRVIQSSGQCEAQTSALRSQSARSARLCVSVAAVEMQGANGDDRGV